MSLYGTHGRKYIRRKCTCLFGEKGGGRPIGRRPGVDRRGMEIRRGTTRRANRYEISIFLVRLCFHCAEGRRDAGRLTLPSLSFGDRACDFIIDEITGEANKSLMALQGLLIVQGRDRSSSSHHLAECKGRLFQN